jgi:hypothetical protein
VKTSAFCRLRPGHSGRACSTQPGGPAEPARFCANAQPPPPDRSLARRRRRATRQRHGRRKSLSRMPTARTTAADRLTCSVIRRSQRSGVQLRGAMVMPTGSAARDTGVHASNHLIAPSRDFGRFEIAADMPRGRVPRNRSSSQANRVSNEVGLMIVRVAYPYCCRDCLPRCWFSLGRVTASASRPHDMSFDTETYHTCIYLVVMELAVLR